MITEQVGVTRFYSAFHFMYVVNGKGKVVQLQAWSGPEDSRKLRFQDFMTTE